MNDTIVNGLAVIGAASCAYWAYRGGAVLLRFAQETPAGASPATVSAAAVSPAPGAPAQAPPDNDIPVIAAAVSAMLGEHRILHIEDTQTGAIWTAEGRWLQQTSHTPR